MAVGLDPNKSLKDCKVNRYTPLQFVTLKVSVEVTYNGNVSTGEVAIPEMMVELEDFLPLVKE